MKRKYLKENLTLIEENDSKLEIITDDNYNPISINIPNKEVKKLKGNMYLIDDDIYVYKKFPFNKQAALMLLNNDTGEIIGGKGNYLFFNLKHEPEKDLLHLDLYDKIKDKNNLDDWFEVLVPTSGPAQTKAGEIVRAINKILYRDWNDGDRFFSGYGIETCGGPAQYLMDNTNDEIAHQLIDIAQDDTRDDDYTKAIEKVKRSILNYLNNNLQLADIKNDDDMYNYDFDEELIPKYDYDCEIPYQIQNHIDAGDITEDDLEDEIGYWEFNGQLNQEANSIQINNGNIYIYEVPEDTYDELDRSFYTALESYGEQLDEEYGDPEERSEDLEEDLNEPDSDTKLYGVFRTGGSIGFNNATQNELHKYNNKGSQGVLIKVFKTNEEAKEYAKSVRKYLTRGEKEYYSMGYFVAPINHKEIEKYNIKLDESLTEKVWKKEVPVEIATQFREAINSEEETMESVIEATNNILDWILKEFPDIDYEIEDLKDSIELISPNDYREADFGEYDEEEEYQETVEDYFNANVLDPLYDLCDTLNIWIPTIGML